MTPRDKGRVNTITIERDGFVVTVRAVRAAAASVAAALVSAADDTPKGSQAADPLACG